ncbi:hypothetical protein [Arenimonas sp.]|uniref:hypothetical protein n=1 Tax=Arenimonas sp. TaxID=1872635 RepID=UPI0025ECBAFB|nr:hypothetical protein [Arenimonas sp.]
MTPRKKTTVPADRLGEPHAQLRGADGKLLGGIVLKDGKWVLGLGGRIVGESDSAAHVLAILKRAAALARAEGREVDLVFSAPLRAAAHKEAEAEGLDFDAFQARLVAQMDAAGKAEP